MLSFVSDMRFGSFDQIIQPGLRRIRQHSALCGSHGDAKANPTAFHLVSLLDSLVAGICKDQRLLAVQEIRGRG
jgi:hypothetical protein